jgi:hypothetical protein
MEVIQKIKRIPNRNRSTGSTSLMDDGENENTRQQIFRRVFCFV